MRKSFALVSFCLLGAYFLSCVGLMPKAPEAMDESAKRLEAPKDRALVYIVRPSVKGFAAKMEVYLNARRVGGTYGRRYLYMLIDPGKHVITSKYGISEFDYIMSLRAGHVYFLEQTGTGLKLLHKAQGYEKLQKCKLASEFSPDGRPLRP